MSKARKALQISVICSLVFFLVRCENTEDLRKGTYLKSIGNCKDAVQHLKNFLATSPSERNKQKAEDSLAECLIKLADNEKQLKHWETGIAYLQEVMDNHPDTPASEKVEDTLPEYLFEWGAQMSAEGKFLESLKILKRLIMTFPASGFAQKGRELRSQIGVIAFNAGTDIYVMNSDVSKLRKISSSAIDATISPDG